MRWRAPISENDVGRLHADAFKTTTGYQWCRHISLGWVTASEGGRLVGFVNVAWDGGRHAVLLDIAVAPDRQRRGIGRQVVLRAVEESRKAGCGWVHVDYERHLYDFYAACGFKSTAAGVMRLL
jgi:GNAT superfamily N-acetyltransferase